MQERKKMVSEENEKREEGRRGYEGRKRKRGLIERGKGRKYERGWNKGGMRGTGRGRINKRREEMDERREGE